MSDMLYQTVGTEQNNSPILGRLEGPCADIINATRNGRKYSEDLWTNVFNDPIVNEYFDCGGIFGELGHPIDDREETDMSKIALVMREKPKKKNGKLWASFDILNTPNGRILDCLCRAGYKMGISSRGSGDVEMDFDGQESVNPNSYRFQAFDAVLLPAVKEARLSYSGAVTESLNIRKSLKESLQESLNNSSLDEQIIMKQTLKDLKLEDLDMEDDNPDAEILHEEEPDDEEKQQETADIDDIEKEMSVDNDKDIMEQYQELLKQLQNLEEQIINLNEKLSVSYAKEANYETELSKYKKIIPKLSESKKQADALAVQNETLNRRLDTITNQHKTDSETINALKEQLDKSMTRNSALSEQLKTANGKLNSLNESVTSQKENNERLIENLNTELAESKKDLQLTRKTYSNKIDKANKLVEQYKGVATKAINRYIESKANNLGISINEIKNKLPERYTFNDIDKVCEDLRDYKVNISKLPFQITGTKLAENMSVKVKPSTNNILDINKINNRIDDDVDEQLLGLSGLN